MKCLHRQRVHNDVFDIVYSTIIFAAQVLQAKCNAQNSSGIITAFLVALVTYNKLLLNINSNVGVLLANVSIYSRLFFNSKSSGRKCNPQEPRRIRFGLYERTVPYSPVRSRAKQTYCATENCIEPLR